jgi:preprotein translocase subunit SecG
MAFIITLMTVLLAFNCLFLILLILIQLPKKEAGAGTAFGGGATDALFGAGTGNALTNITKYAATVFFTLSLVLAIINANQSHAKASRTRELLKQQTAMPAAGVLPPSLAVSNTVEGALRAPASNVLSRAASASATNQGAMAPNKPPASLLSQPSTLLNSNQLLLAPTNKP